MFNMVIIGGKVKTEPKLKTGEAKSGKGTWSVCSFRFDHEYRPFPGAHPSKMRVVVNGWNKMAHELHSHATVGMYLLLQGNIKEKNWKNQKEEWVKDVVVDVERWIQVPQIDGAVVDPLERNHEFTEDDLNDIVGTPKSEPKKEGPIMEDPADDDIPF